MSEKGYKAKVHPDVIAWRKWLESEEGRSCCADSASGTYLENRLWRAFMAGERRRVSRPKERGK
jgi:hypothetical protein